MITIVYITGRLDPRLDLFFDSVTAQIQPTDQVILIDHWLDYCPNRESEVLNLLDKRFDLLHLPPKPSIWRGPHKKTRRDFADTGAARNTALIAAKHSYVVFLDDLTAVHHKWRSFHEEAAKEKIILTGQFKFCRNLKVLPNRRISYRQLGRDERKDHQKDKSRLKIGGGWLFGSNTGFPLDCLLKVGGYDEFTARRGVEDCNLGVRLVNAGYADKMFYDKKCIVYEDQFYHYHMANTQVNHVLNPYIPLRRYKTDDSEDDKKSWDIYYKMEEVENKHLYKDNKYTPINMYFNLEKERKLYKDKGTFRSVENDTYTDYDGQSIEEL